MSLRSLHAGILPRRNASAENAASGTQRLPIYVGCCPLRSSGGHRRRPACVRAVSQIPAQGRIHDAAIFRLRPAQFERGERAGAYQPGARTGCRMMARCGSSPSPTSSSSGCGFSGKNAEASANPAEATRIFLIPNDIKSAVRHGLRPERVYPTPA